MKYNSFPILLLAISLGCIAGCAEHRNTAVPSSSMPGNIPSFQDETNGSFPPTKYKIDGSFDDWKTYETIQTYTGIDWSKVVIEGSNDWIHFTEFYEDNDSNYLYLFFKFKPSIQERYDKNHSAGDVGLLYIDTDANTNTGSTGLTRGAEIQIDFPIGIYAHINPDTNGCFVSYEIKRWNPAAREFSQPVRIADSRYDGAFIAHGEDGVEAAILLTDLRVTEGGQIALTFQGGFAPWKFIKRTAILLK